MPTIYIIGDSTVEDNKPPFRGWGWALPKYVAEGVKVANHAMSGHSSRSFLDEGLFEPVRENATRRCFDDSVWYNDEKNDVNRHTVPDGDYQDYLRIYCRAAIEKGAQPVLLSPVSRRIYLDDGNLLYTHGATLLR